MTMYCFYRLVRYDLDLLFQCQVFWEYNFQAFNYARHMSSSRRKLNKKLNFNQDAYMRARNNITTKLENKNKSKVAYFAPKYVG